MRWLRLGALILIAALYFPAVSSALSPQNHNPDTQNAGKPAGIKPDTNPEGAPASAHKAEQGADDRSKHEERCEYRGPAWFSGFYCFFALHDKFWVAFGTLILAVGTTILGFATVFLWRATRQLVLDAKEASEKQFGASMIAAGAAKESADTAKIQAEVARGTLNAMQDTAERQLRAYLSVMKARIENVAVGEKPKVSFKVKNMGQTPAHKLSGHVGIGIGKYPIPKGSKVNPPPSPDEISRVNLAPTMRVTHGAMMGVPLTEVQFNEIRDGKTAIYVVANIEFADAFDRKWIQRLRLMYTCRGLQSGSNKLEVCEEGNEIEEVIST